MRRKSESDGELRYWSANNGVADIRKMQARFFMVYPWIGGILLCIHEIEVGQFSIYWLRLKYANRQAIPGYDNLI